MRARFYFADGRVAEDVNLDPRTKRQALPDDGRIRWFELTGETESDGYVVWKETAVAPERRRWPR
jgi:hypothetical protein